MQSVLGLAGYSPVRHLQGEKWDSLGPAESRRLRVLAERGPGPAEPSGQPLEPALAALRSYEAIAERKERVTKEARAKPKPDGPRKRGRAASLVRGLRDRVRPDE